jgi:hypothetical protein
MNRWVVSLAIWGLYGVALVLPVFQFEPDPEIGKNVFFGYEAFVLGWAWPGTIPALANVALVVGWIAFLARRARLATGAGVLAVALSLTAPAIYGFGFSALGAGYFLWVASCVALAISAVLDLAGLSDGIPMPTRVRVYFVEEVPNDHIEASGERKNGLDAQPNDQDVNQNA